MPLPGGHRRWQQGWRGLSFVPFLAARLVGRPFRNRLTRDVSSLPVCQVSGPQCVFSTVMVSASEMERRVDNKSNHHYFVFAGHTVFPYTCSISGYFSL